MEIIWIKRTVVASELHVQFDRLLLSSLRHGLRADALSTCKFCRLMPSTIKNFRSGFAACGLNKKQAYGLLRRHAFMPLRKPRVFWPSPRFSLHTLDCWTKDSCSKKNVGVIKRHCVCLYQ